MHDPVHSIFLLSYYHTSSINLCILLLSWAAKQTSKEAYDSVLFSDSLKFSLVLEAILFQILEGFRVLKRCLCPKYR